MNLAGSNDKVTLTSVASDRLGSIGKYYPFGQERPSATANDKEKFTGYYRDSATGLDYADQRYHQPGAGRFITPDAAASASPVDPATQNKYAYVGGEPVNRRDPSGRYSSQDDYDYLTGYSPYAAAVGGIYEQEAQQDADAFGYLLGLYQQGPKGPEGTGPWYGIYANWNLILLAGIAEAASNTATLIGQQSVAYLQVTSDCITMKNIKTLAPSRDVTYQAIGADGQPIGAAITERVLNPSGDLANVLNPISTSFGTFPDQNGLPAFGFDLGTVYEFQYFVTTIPGTYWYSVPTKIRGLNGAFNLVLSIALSRTSVNGKIVLDVSYNGDAGMWNADGSPRLPLCN